VSLGLRPASSLPLDELAGLFTRAYEGYVVPFALNEDQLRLMVDAFDLDLDASRVAYRDNEPVGLCNLGIRGERGWIGGVGVVAGARRQGVGETLMRAVHDVAREKGLQEIWLEVIVENTGAAALYEKLGYRQTRDVEVWSLEAEVGGEAREVPWERAHERVRALRADREPWQRADETLAHYDGLVGLETAGGAAVVRPRGGRALLVQVAGNDTRELVGSARTYGPLQGLNLPEGAAAAAFRDLGADLVVRQHEMVLEL
jgi:ribosomal protein S18 acetylase RimI-like enzyme